MATKPKSMNQVDVFAYTDFRLFMRERYRSLKSCDRTLTYKKLGEVAGFTSPGFFTQLLQNKSRLPAVMVPKLGKALRLTRKEAAYFSLLVEFGQADSHNRKHELFKKVLNHNSGITRTLSPEHYAVFDKWYHIAIRELLYYYKFDGKFNELAKKLSPPISPSEARASVELLERLKLVRRNEYGVYLRSDVDPLSTGFHPESVPINNFLLEMMKLAQQSVEICPPDKRTLSTLTVSLSEGGFHRLEQEVHEFRRRLLLLAKEDINEDRLYQINLQMFPLTRIENNGAHASNERSAASAAVQEPEGGE